MNPNDEKWRRLAALARRVDGESLPLMPVGLATRVASRGLPNVRQAPGVFECLSLRALGIACCLALVGLLAGFASFLQTANTDIGDVIITTNDPAATIMEMMES